MAVLTIRGSASRSFEQELLRDLFVARTKREVLNAAGCEPKCLESKIVAASSVSFGVVLTPRVADADAPR